MNLTMLNKWNIREGNYTFPGLHVPHYSAPSLPSSPAPLFFSNRLDRTVRSSIWMADADSAARALANHFCSI
jgi:hypothetical protein